MRWWFRHLPRYTGITDGVLNNWWHYIVDYNGAVALAEQLIAGIDCNEPFSLEPAQFSLAQNYPNPFNAITKIRFELTAPGHTSLIVFDILGREVARLVDGWQPVGKQELHFDATHLASGVYFYRLTTESFSSTRKLLLLR
ncbi:T9SS type A sorting domain-containing protein [candidate division KSB1 bacterium]|nr:T9SS type A sorting domain-containing protein [candidate division KSB1 bacterium]